MKLRSNAGFAWTTGLLVLALILVAGLFYSSPNSVKAEDAPVIEEPAEPTEPTEPVEPIEPADPVDLDADDDGINDDADNCPADANADQADGDADGAGDACDSIDDSQPTPEVQGASISAPSNNKKAPEGDDNGNGDLDDDGVGDEDDNCPITPNEDQTDADENDVGDACEELTEGPSTEGFAALLNLPSFPSNVDICHANNGNGWVSQSPSINSILKLNNGHNGHSGDIIPPFWYKIVIIPFYFPGKNWDAEGQAIHANECEEVAQGGSITIVKEIAEGSNSEATFEFFVNQESAGTLGDGASTTQALGVGDHTIEEVLPLEGGWQLQSVVCTDGSTLDDGEVNVNLSEGEQVTCTFTNIQVQESCRVEVVSDTSNDVVGGGSAIATWVHELWASITGATWIWDEYEVSNPSATTTETFTKDFYVDGPVNTATLTLAADNTYDVSINGTQVAVNLGEFNYATAVAPFDVSGEVVSGWNTIEFEVSNVGIAGEDDPHQNPAGALYKLVVNGEVKEECKQPDPQDESTLTVVKLVENNFGGTATSSDFNMYVTWYTNNTNDESDPWRGFPGDANGTTFTFNPGTFLVGEDNVPGYSMVIDTNAGPRCSGGQDLHEGEDLTCTVINKQLPIGGDNPSCEELEGEKGWYGEYFNYSWERPDMYHYYSGYPGETYEPFGDTFGTELWGEPTDNTSTSSDWYDMDDEFRFARVDADLEFGESFFPFFNAQVEETTYLPNVDYHFGVHWSAKVDVPVDDSDYNFFGKVDDDLWIYINGVRHDFGNPGPTGVHGPVGISGTLHLSDGDIIDVFYAERSPGQAVMYLEFLDEGISFKPYNDDCNLVCDPKVNLIKNGGFENPELANNSWSIFYSPTALLEWLTNGNGIEIQNSAAGSPFAGEQLAELDPNNPTTIWQDIPTIPGKTYRLETQYSPRPGRDAEDNRFEFRLDGGALGASIARSGVANGDTVWTLESRTFVADDNEASVGFAEVGTDTSYGAYLDEVGLYCIPEAPADTSDVTICKHDGSHIDGDTLPGWYVWLDHAIDEAFALDIVQEHDYAGTTSDIQDEGYGCVILENVEFGTYNLGEDLQEGWEFEYSSEGENGSVVVDSETESFYIVNDQEDGGGSGDPDLTLEKSGVYNEETGTITFTLDWSVTGEGTIYDVTITDPVPTGTNFVSADNGGFLSGSDVVWNLGTQVSGATGTVSFTVSLDEVAAIGFYASGYNSNLQGTRKDGSPINVDRTDPTDAFGAPQSAGLPNDAPVVAGSFFALGFTQAPAVGGSIVLTFSDPVMNGAGNDLKVFEVTGGTYPDEKVQVEAWDGSNWINLGLVTRDGEVDLGSVLATNQIRLTDVSVKASFPNDGDAYDLDALQAYYTADSVCSIDNTATISGNEEGEVYPTFVATVYDGDDDSEYDFYASASTTVTVDEEECEPQEDGGSITIIKEIAGDTQYDGNFEFTSEELGNFGLAAGASTTFTGLAAGDYSFDELVPGGWSNPAVSCSDESTSDVDGIDMVVDLAQGEDVTCTFINRKPTDGDPTQTSQLIVVRDADLADSFLDVLADRTKWFFYNDETDVIDNSLGSFVFGPATAPIGDGSAQMSVSGTQRRNIATYQFNDVPLDELDNLVFSTYSHSAGNGSPASERSTYLHFNVDFNNSDTWQNRLVFVPSLNGVVVNDSWQTWDAINGGNALWLFSGAVWPTTSEAEVGVPGTTAKTWNEILIDYPNAETRSTDSWFGFRVGEPYADGFTGNVDEFIITVNDGSNATTTTFDFEPDSQTPGDDDDSGDDDDDDDDNGRRSGSNRNSFSGGGEVLGASTATCPFLRDYQHINMQNDPSEVNKAKAFFNAYLGKSLVLDGIFDQAMFDAVWEFQSMFQSDVLNTWVEEFPGLLDNRPTGYLYQTTKWKINSIMCPGYETFPDQLIMAPGTTVR
ncbi:MAG: hypothetical protein KBD16_02740 [Candidatus Pacebacteria bacterium]|nr:hypothetical protein [Candidatus Paceibacterota bacterium]